MSPHQGLQCLLRYKIIFSDRNTLFYRKLTGKPLTFKMDNAMLIVSIWDISLGLILSLFMFTYELLSPESTSPLETWEAPFWFTTGTFTSFVVSSNVLPRQSTGATLYVSSRSTKLMSIVY